MRLQSIQPDGKFRKFVRTPFEVKHEEAVLERWLEQNPDAILEDSPVLLIGRQVPTNLRTFIDLLGIDKSGRTVVIELKRDRTPRDTLAQALEYTSFVETLDSDQLEELFHGYTGEEAALGDYHRQYFELDAEDAVSFNKEQRIVLVGQSITPEIRQTSLFLRRKGLRVTCLEFGFFQADGGLQLLSSDIVVGQEPDRIEKLETGSQKKITKDEFLSSLDSNGLAFFGPLLEFAGKHGYPIVWGVSGFSMNVDIGGEFVVLCFGYRPQSVYHQSLYTDLYRKGGLLTKTAITLEFADSMRDKARESGLFEPARRESKFLINRQLSDNEFRAVIDWIEELAAMIREKGLAE